MRKYFSLNYIKVFFFLCLINTLQSFGQSSDTFTLKGECDVQSGTAHLVTLDSSYYKCKIVSYDTNIIDGKFELNATIEYPYLFRLFIKRDTNIIYFSEQFFINKGNQEIKVNSKELGGMPVINNSTMKELRSSYANWFNKYNLKVIRSIIKRDSLNAVYKNGLPSKVDSYLAKEMKLLSNENDVLLLSYTKKYPSSYLALWELVKKITANGYNDIYESIANSFSDKIKKTYTAKVLFENLKDARVAKIGNQFPTLHLSDSKKNITLESVHLNNKFTLVDFWFSSCSPCKAQFQELRKLYNKYSSKGFIIIGISVDQKEDIPKWKETIKNYSLVWKQYLDIDQKESRKLSIMAFPSNFLLDENGRTIAKNITLNELSLILEKNFE